MNQPDTALSVEESSRLRMLARLMIPADEPLGMPGADDPLIQGDLVRSIGRDLPAVREALQSFTPGREVDDWYAAGGDATRTLGRLLLSAYYRDDRVLLALGHEARAPFPKGYEVEQGDWSLLEAVRERPPFWREDRRDA